MNVMFCIAFIHQVLSLDPCCYLFCNILHPVPKYCLLSWICFPLPLREIKACNQQKTESRFEQVNEPKSTRQGLQANCGCNVVKEKRNHRSRRDQQETKCDLNLDDKPAYCTQIERRRVWDFTWFEILLALPDKWRNKDVIAILTTCKSYCTVKFWEMLRWHALYILVSYRSGCITLKSMMVRTLASYLRYHHFSRFLVFPSFSSLYRHCIRAISSTQRFSTDIYAQKQNRISWTAQSYLHLLCTCWCVPCPEKVKC